MTSDDFNTSTEVVCQRLGVSYKTLCRRRTDVKDRRTPKLLQFLEPGIHFKRKTPESKRLVWNWARTERAWQQAMKIADSQRGAA
jgi:hypothetical protein